MTNELQILANLGTTAAESAITQYTYWHFANALVWLLFGLSLLFIGYKFWKSEYLNDSYDREKKMAICGVLWFIGVMVFFVNITNLIFPRAYAIHQFITDVTN